MKRVLPILLLLLLPGFFAGCASYEVAKTRPLTGVQRYFVLTSPNDGHALDRQIVAALTRRGYQAESGPHTMLPDEAQAVVTYQDHWTWDFGDHLVYLQVGIQDRKTNQPYASVAFSATVPSRKSAADITDELVGRLVPSKP